MKMECPLLLVGQLSKMTNKTPDIANVRGYGITFPVERSSSGYRKRGSAGTTASSIY